MFSLWDCGREYVRQWSPGSCHFWLPTGSARLRWLTRITLLRDRRIHLPRKEILYILVSRKMTKNARADAVSRWIFSLLKVLSAFHTCWKCVHGGGSHPWHDSKFSLSRAKVHLKKRWWGRNPDSRCPSLNAMRLCQSCSVNKNCLWTLKKHALYHFGMALISLSWRSKQAFYYKLCETHPLPTHSLAGNKIQLAKMVHV